jgi:hypothetical protein
LSEPQQGEKQVVKDVFVIEVAKGKSYWHNVGVGFVNKDGSLSLKLHLFPQLYLQVRDRKEPAPQ